MKSVHLVIFVTLFFSIFILQTPVNAINDQIPESVVVEVESSEEDSTENATDTDVQFEEVNSFELFWPVAAGKTKGESLYFLKRFKENLRGALIFGDAKAADYNLFLATKRVVEAEKLIREDKHDRAKETLEEAYKRVAKANERWSTVEGEVTTTKHEMNNKLNNLEKFLPYLGNQESNDDIKAEIKSLHEAVKQLNEQV